LPAHSSLCGHSASGNGADVVSSSTHKEIGGLQGTAVVVLPHGSRMTHHEVSAAFRAMTTTSPSYLLLVSIESVYERMNVVGELLIGRMIDLSNRLRALVDRWSTYYGLGVVDVVADLVGRNLPTDPLKVTFAVPSCNKTGFELAEALADGMGGTRVFVEKEGLNTITFLITLQMLEPDRDDIAIMADQFRAAVMNAGRPVAPRQPPANPFALTRGNGTNGFEAIRDGLLKGERIELRHAAGRTSAERVAAYPPGVPVILEGDVVTAEQVKFLLGVEHVGGHLATNGGRALYDRGTVDGVESNVPMLVVLPLGK
jgi:arginine decarboxylase